MTMRNRDKNVSLTKREVAAIAAMQGLLSNATYLMEANALGVCVSRRALVNEAIITVDALFDELEKETP